MSTDTNKMSKLQKLFIIISLIILVPIFIVFFTKYNWRSSANFTLTVEDSLDAIEGMDEHGIYSNSEEWKDSKPKFIEQIKSSENDYNRFSILNDAIKIAGGKHSFIFTGEFRDLLNKNDVNDSIPSFKIVDNVLILELPDTISFPPNEFDKYVEIYSNILSDAIHENTNVDGIIVDLSNNGGGSVLPMINGLSSLLPEGHVLNYIDKNDLPMQKYSIGDGEFKSLIGYELNYSLHANNSNIKVEKPVAVITSETTGSAAEITAIAFKGLENVKSFGKPTAGFSSGNASIEIVPNVTIALTSAHVQSRTGEIYRDTEIQPDIEVNLDSAIKSAIEWIKSEHTK